MRSTSVRVCLNTDDVLTFVTLSANYTPNKEYEINSLSLSVTYCLGVREKLLCIFTTELEKVLSV